MYLCMNGPSLLLLYPPLSFSLHVVIILLSSLSLLQEDHELYEKMFANYIKEGVSGDEFEDLLEKVGR